MTDPALQEQPAPPVRTSAGQRFVLAASLILSAVALSGAAWAYLVIERQAGMENRQDVVARTLQEKIDAQQRALGALEAAGRKSQEDIAALAAREAEVEKSLGALVEEEKQAGLELALAEAEYLLVLGSHRLTLSRDPQTALAAVESAHNRLTGLDAPGLDEVRAQLETDMAALRDTQEVDLASLSSYLADLSSRADKLAFKGDAAAPEKKAPGAASTGEPGWRGIWRAVLRELRSLVMITRSKTSAPAAVLPEQRWFLVQNLKLQLETARLAVLKEDTASLRASITTALDWLDAYFDRSDADVANAMESLGRMAELELRPDLPDLSSSLETVRASRYRAGATGRDQPSP